MKVRGAASAMVSKDAADELQRNCRSDVVRNRMRNRELGGRLG